MVEDLDYRDVIKGKVINIIDEHKATVDQLPKEYFVNGKIMIAISGYTAEQFQIDEKKETFYTTIAFGETPYDIEIPLIFISMFCLPNGVPILFRPFEADIIEDTQLSQTTLCSPVVIKSDISEFEKSNAEGIAHSMSRLTLLKS